MPIRWPLRLATALTALLLATASATSASAQLYVAFGSPLYSTDEFCLSSSATVTDARVGYDFGGIGVSTSYNNEDFPWPPPPPPGGGASVLPANLLLYPGVAQEQVYMTRGESFQASVDFFPLQLIPALREATGTLNRYIRPFVGVGVQVTRDGEPEAASAERPLDTWSLNGGINPVVAYGATVNIPKEIGGIGLRLQLRGTSLFASKFEFETPTGQTITNEDGKVLSWFSYLVGFNIGI